MQIDPYHDRHTAGEERVCKIQLLEKILSEFEYQVQEHSKQREERLEKNYERLKIVQNTIEDEKRARVEFETNLNANLQNLEKGGKRIIELFSDFRSEQENQVLSKMQQQIESLTKEVNRNIQEKLQGHNYVLQYLENDIPQLRLQLQQEQNNRNELEDRIQQQFLEQISELRYNIEEERREREQKEEEIINYLQNICMKVHTMTDKVRKDREQNEEMIIKLIDQVIHKIKKEIIDTNL